MIALPDDLGPALGSPLDERACRIEPLATASTHPIARVRLVFAGGGTLAGVLKRLDPQPGRDVATETRVYLRLRPAGAPALLAAGRGWLLLEDVGAQRLDWCGERHWLRALRWLARLHGHWEGRTAQLAAVHAHDEAFFAALAQDTATTVEANGTHAAAARYARLRPAIATAGRRLAARRRTLVHGDFSAKNVMLQHGGRVRVIDWEWAALGVPAWDVVKLLAGWGPRKPELLAHYLRARPRAIDRDELAAAEAFKTVWYLRWWIDACRDPGHVDRLLDGLERRLESADA